jgi:ABC-2 type transport system permease protein
MRGRTWSLIRKEFIQFFRDRMLLILILWIFAEVALCGYALGFEVKHISTVVYNSDRSQASRQLLNKLNGSPYFDLNYYVDGYSQLTDLIDRGQAVMGIVIPSDYSGDLKRGSPAKVQLIADGSDSTTASMALGYATRIIQSHSQNIALERISLPAGEPGGSPGVVNQLRVWYMPELKYSHFIMIAMIAIAGFMLAILLPAAAIVREKEAGTLEQLMVTPIRPFELILAKVLPMATLKVVGLGIGVAEALLLFGTPFRGNAALFLALSIVFMLSSMGLGVLISTWCRNFQQALLSSFFILFPIMFLSGTMAPVESMPKVLQLFAYANPLTYYVQISVGIFLRGAGFGTLWPQTLAMVAFGVATFGLGLFMFRRSLS